MRVLVDENIPRMTVDALANLGHDVRDVRGTADEGGSDQDLWELARHEQRLLITTDKGFFSHRDCEHAGILIVRLRQPNRQRIHDRVLQALDQFPEEEWPGMVVIMRDRAQSRWRGPEDV
ncbi:MAG: DUF5615 family PIN-like protein [Planctomycetota bacterium]